MHSAVSPTATASDTASPKIRNNSYIANNHPTTEANLYIVRLNSRTVKSNMKRSFMRTGGNLPGEEIIRNPAYNCTFPQ
jgi:hypothetical protein